MQNHVKTGSESPCRQKLDVAPKVMLSIAVDNRDIVAPEAQNACEAEGRPSLTVPALWYTDCEDEWTGKRPTGRGGRSSALNIHSPIVLHTTTLNGKNIVSCIPALIRSVLPTCLEPHRYTLIKTQAS